MGSKRLKEEDWIGKFFGRLVVLGRYGRDEGLGTSGRLWRCLCQCGTYCDTRISALTSGHTRSCGCLQRETVGARRFLHGATSRKLDLTSDLARTYSSWYNMRHRCGYEKHESYADYGGRGIGIDPRWEEFAAFLADMGPCPKGYCIERHDNERGYTPSNCSWWPKSYQQMNTRRTIRLMYQGEEWCLLKLCQHLGLTYTTVRENYKNKGFSISLALNLPEGKVHELDVR